MSYTQLDTDTKRLWLRVKPDSPLNQEMCIDFVRDCTSEIEATLLEQHINKLIHDRTQEIRKVS